MVDASGSSHWKYDDRGRVISETKRIDTATYWTQWTYDPQDRVLTQTYPGGDAGQAGEVVTTAYGKWGHPATLTGTDNPAGSFGYVVKAMPDDAGRIDYFPAGSFGKLGGSDPAPVLILDYKPAGSFGYYPWNTANGRGRLQQIKVDPPATPDSLQKLTYTSAGRFAYDATGNVTQVAQNAPTPSETLNYTSAGRFAYDDLDRLTGVSGAYSASYSFSPVGNITTKEGGSYTYDTAKKHAVKMVKGTGGSTKTVTIQAKGVSYGGIWPHAKRPAEMKLRVNGVDVQTLRAAPLRAGPFGLRPSGQAVDRQLLDLHRLLRQRHHHRQGHPERHLHQRHEHPRAAGGLSVRRRHAGPGLRIPRPHLQIRQ